MGCVCLFYACRTHQHLCVVVPWLIVEFVGWSLDENPVFILPMVGEAGSMLISSSLGCLVAFTMALYVVEYIYVLEVIFHVEWVFTIYSRTSLARTPMAGLPWMSRKRS